MKIETIKKFLKPYSIHNKRKTTISHAFASAIAPCDDYNEGTVRKAIKHLRQNPEENLKCVYCDNPAETWDHLANLVRKSELRGYGHQLGNLVPCCKKCNSQKSAKDFDKFLKGTPTTGHRKKLQLLNRYHRLATPVDVNRLKSMKKYARYEELKRKIWELMKEADEVASALRRSIGKTLKTASQRGRRK